MRKLSKTRVHAATSDEVRTPGLLSRCFDRVNAPGAALTAVVMLAAIIAADTMDMTRRLDTPKSPTTLAHERIYRAAGALVQLPCRVDGTWQTSEPAAGTTPYTILHTTIRTVYREQPAGLGIADTGLPYQYQVAAQIDDLRPDGTLRSSMEVTPTLLPSEEPGDQVAALAVIVPPEDTMTITFSRQTTVAIDGGMMYGNMAPCGSVDVSPLSPAQRQ